MGLKARHRRHREANPFNRRKQPVGASGNPQPTSTLTRPLSHLASALSEGRGDMSEELITPERPRIKFELRRAGKLQLRVAGDELERLRELQCQLEVEGLCPVLNDGKIGGNCAVKLSHVCPPSVTDEPVDTILVSKSGKEPGAALLVQDWVAVDDFERCSWSARFRSVDEGVRPSSDTPLLWAALGPGAAERYGWTGDLPRVAVHGHALAAGEELENAARRGIPISERVTLFSTPEDLRELEVLFAGFTYPTHKCFIRKGHGFIVLGQNIDDVIRTFNACVKPCL